MSVQNVSGINTVGAKSLPAKQIQSTEQIQTEKKGGKKKLALALGALAAVGIAGIAIAKGKKAPLETINLDKFKEIGTFNKGFASIDGKPFTGIINASNKNGNFVLEYVDGILQSSKKFETGVLDGAPVLEKRYFTNKAGEKVVQKFEQGFTGLIKTAETTFKKDGLILKETNKETVKNGAVVMQTVRTILDEGKVADQVFHEQAIPLIK